MNLDQTQAASLHLDRATAAFNAQQADAAWNHLRRALNLCPDLAGARILEARIHLSCRRPAQSLAGLDALVQDQPEQNRAPEVCLLRAQALLQLGQSDAATGLLEDFARRFPDDVRPWRWLAGIHLEHDCAPQALEALHQVLRLAPGDPAARRLIEDLGARIHPTITADALLRRAQRQPSPLEHLRAARLLVQVGRLREALDQYLWLTAGHGEDAALLEEAGALADQMGEDYLARHWLMAAVALKRSNQAGALRRLACVHLHAGSFAAAAFWFWRLARRGDPQAHAGLFVGALLTGRRRLAQRAAQALARHLSRQERRAALTALWREAAAGIELARTRCGADPIPSGDRGLLRPLLAKARTTLAGHARQFPRRADVQYHLAVCQSALGEVAQANHAVECALAINPRYAAARRLWFGLARAQRQAA